MNAKIQKTFKLTIGSNFEEVLMEDVLTEAFNMEFNFNQTSTEFRAHIEKLPEEKEIDKGKLAEEIIVLIKSWSRRAEEDCEDCIADVKALLERN